MISAGAQGAGAQQTAHGKTPPAVFGMVLFIASETMFFAAFFGAYFMLRGMTAQWPPPGVRLDLWEPILLTAIITLTTLTIRLARIALGKNRMAAMRSWVGATLGLGLAFLAVEYHEWAHTDFKVTSNAYGSLFYTMTGFHGIHVLVGLALLGGLLAGTTGSVARIDAHRAGAEAIAYYWHFLYAVWLCLFAIIYLLK